MAKYTVKIFPPKELNHSSYVQTGLFELEKLGVIKLEINLWGVSNKGQIEILEDLRLKKTKISHRKTSFYLLTDNSNGQAISFAVDLYDHADKFSLSALESCDYVFKRNFRTEYVEALGDLGKNVYKMGLAFGVHSSYKRKEHIFFFGLLFQNLKNNLKLDSQFFKRLYRTYRSQITHWKFVQNTRTLGMFRIGQQKESNIILFQTRCFSKENLIDVKQINTQRYNLIKLLKEQFPEVFKGGFTESPLVKDKYFDAISNIPSDPIKYLNKVKESKIVIYTRGLANSPAWKLAEYLALGKVILAEPLKTELPVPLEDGKEILYFRNNAELVEKVKVVLSNQVLADRISKNARLYFEKHVHPTRNMKRIIDIMLNQKQA